jgi:hypothetical protein
LGFAPGVSIDGNNRPGIGGYGNSGTFDAVVGESQSDGHAGVTGRNLSSTPGPDAVGIYGVGGTYAGKFDGNVLVNGTATVNSGFAALADTTVGEDLIVTGTVRPWWSAS